MPVLLIGTIDTIHEDETYGRPREKDVVDTRSVDLGGPSSTRLRPCLSLFEDGSGHDGDPAGHTKMGLEAERPNGQRLGRSNTGTGYDICAGQSSAPTHCGHAGSL
jgi:hypothetical protein